MRVLCFVFVGFFVCVFFLRMDHVVAFKMDSRIV